MIDLGDGRGYSRLPGALLLLPLNQLPPLCVLLCPQLCQLPLLPLYQLPPFLLLPRNQLVPPFPPRRRRLTWTPWFSSIPCRSLASW